ncbi:uncharacterized protein N0V89_009169 [Didymosphaeria variabile]|uniref:Uncharacterized protein n=1 Tax=Didymosphaeria variabile TaxID=1932322 RepID=A0A9W8XEL9_9PLEO|nr:uncharacterized protein N0V89_009169 [Didymosphaeria variabile]KAJ4347799.1 hypothetical protein N0V89_009169 [Didymosphaeria variabile]
MGLSQVGESYENDGNFSEISLLDTQKGGDVSRLENFRCSHPDGTLTRSGTTVKAIVGEEHLALDSNRTFRMIYSKGSGNQILSRLEMREFYDEDGSYICTIRNIDGNDPAFGTAMISTVKPIDNAISINYKIVVPGPVRKQYIYSPNTTTVQDQAKGLVDLAKVGDLDTDTALDFQLALEGDNTEPMDKLAQWAAGVRDQYPLWSKNVVSYLRMGDFRDKRIHNGTNLTGDHTLLASEFVPLSNYRVSLVTSGKIFDLAMAGGAHETHLQTPLLIDSKPGNYSPFLLAYGHNIVLTQLGIDKVHSDYSGVPMKIAPGSRMENGAKPVVDSTNLNRSLALVSAFFYAPDALHSIVNTTPKILAFGGQKKFKAVLPSRT